MVQTCCEAVKSSKNHRKWLEILELDSQAARVENFEKITLGRPPGQPLPAQTLTGPPGL